MSALRRGYCRWCRITLAVGQHGDVGLTIKDRAWVHIIKKGWSKCIGGGVGLMIDEVESLEDFNI